MNENMIRNKLLSKEVARRNSAQVFDLSKIASNGLIPLVHRNNIMKSLFFLILLPFSLMAGSYQLVPYSLTVNAHQKYEDLKNPVEYVFDFPIGQVEHTLDKMNGLEMGISHFSTRSGEYGYFWGLVVEGYCSRYWDGPIDENDDSSGRIGEILGFYDIEVSDISGKTRVAVKVYELKQQIGRRWYFFPCPKKIGIWSKIKSDTYFEYLFLLNLGERLGQKGMPPLRGQPIGAGR